MDFDWEASQCGVAVAWATVLQFSEATSEWVSRVGNAAWPRIEAILDFASNPWARALGLGLIVYFTIRVIASVYSGDKQNSEMGPVGIRPHMGKRLDRHSVMLPHSLMSMTMDGVSANCRVFYVYRDAQGKRRKKEVYRQRNMRLAISPSRLRECRAGSARTPASTRPTCARPAAFPASAPARTAAPACRSTAPRK